MKIECAHLFAAVSLGVMSVVGCGSPGPDPRRESNLTDDSPAVVLNNSSTRSQPPSDTIPETDDQPIDPVAMPIASTARIASTAPMNEPIEDVDTQNEASSAEMLQEEAATLEEVTSKAEAPEAEPLEAKAVSEAISAPSYAYRLWLPTTAGPMLAGLNVTIDDRPLEEAFEQKMTEILASASEQVSEASDSKIEAQKAITWGELLAGISLDAETFGQSLSRMARQTRNIIKQYDRNQNGQVDRDELKRFLFRSSTSRSEFRLVGTDAYRWVNRSESGLFRAIDLNQNRLLDGAEIEQASDTLLRMVDQNVDGCISMSEALNQTENDEDAWGSGRLPRDGNVAMDLSGYLNWDNLSYSMGGWLKLASGSQVTGSQVTGLLASINHDSDDWISEQEAKSVLELSPSLAIDLKLYSAKPSPSVISVVVHDQDALARVDSLSAQQTVLNSAQGLRIIVENTPSRSRQNRLPLDVFTQLDANQDGGIDETEIPSGAEDRIPFESLDENDDGKLSFQEINQAVPQKESIWNYQLRGRAAEHPDGVFAYLDLNQDQFLSSREIHHAPIRLRELVGTSGSLKSNQIPDTYTLRFGRGEPEQDASRFGFRRKLPHTQDSRPRWARRLDANGDGEISENEFLGPIATFRELDLDANRFLSNEEVMAADR